MIYKIYTDIEIDAPPELVWKALTDFSAYPDWNPLICKANSQPEENKELTIYVPLFGLKIPCKISIMRLDPGRELRWFGKLLNSSIFMGEHAFEINPEEDNKTHLIHYEVYTGVLSPFFARVAGDFLKNWFTDMNAALKKEAEKQHSQKE